MNRKQFITNLGVGALGATSIINAQLNSPHINKLPNTDDWKSIYKQFKVFKNYTYMNNGTMGINPTPVLESLNDAFLYTAEHGEYSSDFKSLKLALSNIMGINYKTIAITKNVTEGINIACWGNNLNKGDEVLMTTHEHVGSCAAWLYRAKIEGIRVKTFALGNTAEETISNFQKAITPQTKIVAIPHIPCTIGQILPVKEICKIAREKEIISIIDGAHPLGMIRLNIADIDCDYYSGCLHKWLLAPLGMGFIYIRPDRLEKTKIYNIGAHSIPSFDMTAENLISENLVDEAQRFSPGTFSAPVYKASIRAIEWYETIGIDRVEKRVKELSLYAQLELRKLNNVIRVVSPMEDISRGGITSFQFMNKESNGFLEFARSSKHKFVLRYVHEGGVNAFRISTHYYNTFEHIDQLMETIRLYLKV